jgi:hypothetical protein
MTFALAAAARAARDTWEHKDGKFLRKEKPFANYVPPKDDDDAPSPAIRESFVGEKSQPIVDHDSGSPRISDEAVSTLDQALMPKPSDHEPRLDRASLLSIPAVGAAVTANGTLMDVQVEATGAQSWGPTNRQAANATLGRIATIGKAIQDFGSAEEKEAWRQIKKIVLEDNPASEAGVAQNEGETFRVDLSKLGQGGDPRNAPDPNFVIFMLAHEIFHGTKSDRAAQEAALKLQDGKRQEGRPPAIGTPQWSAEVRHDKRVYDFLVRTGLLGNPPPPIERIAPYYWEHLKNPKVRVHVFPGVPGYDRPLD